MKNYLPVEFSQLRKFKRRINRQDIPKHQKEKLSKSRMVERKSF